ANGTARSDGHRSEETLVDQGLITSERLAIFTSMQLGIPYVNLRTRSIDPSVVEGLPEATARKYGIMPLEMDGNVLVVAIGDPANIQITEELAALTRKRIEPVISTPEDILETIGVNYRASGEIEKQLSQIPMAGQRAGSAGSAAQRVSADAVAQAPVVRAIDLLIKQAVRDRASDVHMEPDENKLRVRFRIDGILHESMSLPLEVHAPLISRLKIMAGMNIAERRRPQDGQITLKEGDKEIDIRVATSNTIHGEMAVLRILDKTFAFRTLPELGISPSTMETYERMLKTPFGMLVISGPTGSGKTTTLYASVNMIDSVGRNIITIEDPVEYRFSNINQMQVNPAAGVTFAGGLRACMRLDPDVILVGEIRDAETAQIGIQAALTGHLVLSSVHANDAVGTLFRLIDLGAEPFLVASAIIGCAAQRMARRVCPHCARMGEATPEEQLAYEREMGEKRTEFLHGAGCNVCAGTGYLGRIAIFEVFVISEAIRRMILSRASTDDLRNQAMQEGMVNLWHDGMEKVKLGLTTPHEVIRNVYSIG
ncbi:MAG: ATPase, T2SS/T4P/T4SS family, partial [Dehalococcoidia bacterium]